MWYGIQMPVVHDEATTPDNPFKMYAFQWTNPKGKRRSTLLSYETLEQAVKAAAAHRTLHPDNTDYGVIGRAVASFAF